MIDERNGVNYANLKGYNRDGSPVFNKKIVEINVLNKRTNSEKVVFGIVFAIFVIHSFTLIFPVITYLSLRLSNLLHMVSIGLSPCTKSNFRGGKMIRYT